MKIIVSGYSGYMGKEVVKALEKGYCGSELRGGIDIMLKDETTDIPVARSFEEAEALFPKGSFDCIIDFSHHSAVSGLLAYARKVGAPVVVATTGHTESELSEISAAAKDIPIFFSANMSVGVAVLVKLAKTAAAMLPDAEIEIIEKHHDRKLDAPSGTAVMLFDEIKTVRPNATAVYGRSGHGKRHFDDIGIHAIRMGNVVGEHEVILATPTETISLKHEAHDRALFAEGAIVAASFLYKMDKGLYNMHDIMKD